MERRLKISGLAYNCVGNVTFQKTEAFAKVEK